MPNGIVFLAVSYYKELYEDYSIVNPKERELAFGQCDHVRKYDFATFIDRVRSVGFNIEVSYVKNYSPLFDATLLVSNIIIARK